MESAKFTKSVVPENIKIGFIGAGRMASAMTIGFIKSGLVKPENVIASDPLQENKNAFKDLGANVAENNIEVVIKSELIVLAVKPNIVQSVLREVSKSVDPGHLIVSIAAGITINRIEECLPTGIRVVRVMPNTPALVQAGAAVVSPGKAAFPQDTKLVAELFRSVGICEEGSESLLDAVTGLSGSGPAYVFAAIEAMADGGVKMGLPRDLSVKLAAQTMLGAAKMVLETGKHPGQLKDEVCSPGGTTISAMHVLEKNCFRGCLIDAVEAATLKSQELGKQTSK